MNKETLAGKWHQIKGSVKQKWGKLTDSDIAQINGKREILLGKLESRYGLAKEKAEKEIQDFERSCGCETAYAAPTSQPNVKGAHGTPHQGSVGQNPTFGKTNPDRGNKDFGGKRK